MNESIVSIISWIKNLITQNFSAITGLFGVYIGASLARRQMNKERKLRFYEKQLREFYSPLLGVRKEIQILSEFRLAGEQAQNEWWQDVCKRGNNIKDISNVKEYYDKEGKQITSQIDYENRQLVDKIIPSYRKMVDIFKNNYWLAEIETKEYFPILIKFVETWERHLSRSHSMEVLKEISVSEDKLMTFYKDLEDQCSVLREKLKSGKP